MNTFYKKFLTAFFLLLILAGAVQAEEMKDCFELDILAPSTISGIVDTVSLPSCGFAYCNTYGGLLNSYCNCETINNNNYCFKELRCPENTSPKHKTLNEQKSEDFSLLILEDEYSQKYKILLRKNNSEEFHNLKIVDLKQEFSQNIFRKRVDVLVTNKESYAKVHFLYYEDKNIKVLPYKIDIQAKEIQKKNTKEINIVEKLFKNQNIELESLEFQKKIIGGTKGLTSHLVFKIQNELVILKLTFLENEKGTELTEKYEISKKIQIQQEHQIKKELKDIIQNHLLHQENFVLEVIQIIERDLKSSTKVIIKIPEQNLEEDYKNRLVSNHEQLTIKFEETQELQINIVQTQDEDSYMFMSQSKLYLIPLLKNNIYNEQKTKKIINDKNNYKTIKIEDIFKDQIILQEVNQEEFEESKKFFIQQITLEEVRINQDLSFSEGKIIFNKTDTTLQEESKKLTEHPKKLQAEVFLTNKDEVDDDALYRLPFRSPFKLMLWFSEENKIENYQEQNICNKQIEEIRITITSKDKKDKHFYREQLPLQINEEEGCYFQISSPFVMYHYVKIGELQNRSHGLYEIQAEAIIKEEGQKFLTRATDELRFWNTENPEKLGNIYGLSGEFKEPTSTVKTQKQEEKEITPKIIYEAGDEFKKIRNFYEHKNSYVVEKEKSLFTCFPNNIEKVGNCRKKGGDWYNNIIIRNNLFNGFKGLEKIKLNELLEEDNFFKEIGLSCYKDTSKKDECGDEGQIMCAFGCLNQLSPCGEKAICKENCDSKTNFSSVKKEEDKIKITKNDEEIVVELADEDEVKETHGLKTDIILIDNIEVGYYEESERITFQKANTINIPETNLENYFIKIEISGINCEKDSILIDLGLIGQQKNVDITQGGFFYSPKSFQPKKSNYLETYEQKSFCTDNKLLIALQLLPDEWKEIPQGTYKLRVLTQKRTEENILEENQKNWGLGNKHIFNSPTQEMPAYCPIPQMPTIQSGQLSIPEYEHQIETREIEHTQIYTTQEIPQSISNIPFAGFTTQTPHLELSPKEYSEYLATIRQRQNEECTDEIVLSDCGEGTIIIKGIGIDNICWYKNMFTRPSFSEARVSCEIINWRGQEHIKEEGGINNYLNKNDWRLPEINELISLFINLPPVTKQAHYYYSETACELLSNIGFTYCIEILEKNFNLYTYWSNTLSEQNAPQIYRIRQGEENQIITGSESRRVDPPPFGFCVRDITNIVEEQQHQHEESGINYNFVNGEITWTTNDFELKKEIENKAQTVGARSGVFFGNFIPLIMGENILFFEQVISYSPGLTYLFVHPNELIAYGAIKDHVSKTGGIGILFIGEKEHPNQRSRYVSFEHDGLTFGFDPNRVFEGGNILRNHMVAVGNQMQGFTGNTQYDKYQEKIEKEIKKYVDFIDWIIEEIVQGPVIVVHDNSGAAGMNWAKNILEGQSSNIARNYHLGNTWNMYDFAYVTKQDTFNRLKAHDFNLILQDNINVPRDGSFSVHLRNSEKPYINLEILRARNENEGRRIGVELLEIIHQEYFEPITT